MKMLKIFSFFPFYVSYLLMGLFSDLKKLGNTFKLVLILPSVHYCVIFLQNQINRWGNKIHSATFFQG